MGDFIKKESESLINTGLEIPRDYNYKKGEIDDNNELFKNIDVDKVRIIIHSIRYVIDEDRYEDDVYKYIQVKFELEYADERFAEYSVSYDLTGKYIEDYILSI